MPAKTTRTDLKGFDFSKELAAHANDEIKYGRIELPHGIKDGVAVLEECYFALGENGAWKGKPYLRCMGTVIEPEYHNNKKVAGLQTSVMVPLFEQGETSKDENVARVQQELGRLGGPESVKGLKNGTDLAVVAAAIESAKPTFRFSTSPRLAQEDNKEKGIKKGDVTGVWENWHGTRGLENYTPSNNGKKSAVNTDKMPQVEANGKATTAPVPPEDVDNSDLDSLLARANNQDGEAKTRLTEMAVGAGFSETEVDAADSWEAVLEMIRHGKPTTKSEGKAKEKEPEKISGESRGNTPSKEEKGKAWVPAVGDTPKYAPPGKKAGSKLKPVDVKVLSVDESDSTVNLASVADKKIKFNDVSWDELIYD